MQITSTFITLDYKIPISIKGKLFTSNDFLQIQLEGKDFFFSVLPSIHESTLLEVSRAIHSFFELNNLDFKHLDFKKKFFNTIDDSLFQNAIPNEILFFIETLLLEMILIKFPILFSTEKNLTNELYSPALDLDEYKNSKCLKIKISPRDKTQCLFLIKKLHSLNPELIIRLDGNRYFELTELIDFVDTLQGELGEKSFSLIDYIEEPFTNFYDLFLFQKRRSIKIAMDESFFTYQKLSGKNIPKNIPIVIKPSLFGITPMLRFMKAHPNHRFIISSTFEHPTAMLGLSLLASKNPLEIHGLQSFF